MVHLQLSVGTPQLLYLPPGYPSFRQEFDSAAILTGTSFDAKPRLGWVRPASSHERLCATTPFSTGQSRPWEVARIARLGTPTSAELAGNSVKRDWQRWKF